MTDWTRWCAFRGPQAMGSGHLAGRLEKALDHLRHHFGVAVPPSGRHRGALVTLERWNLSDAPIDLSDSSELKRISEAHRLAWETYIIVVAAIEDRRNAQTPFTRARFDFMMRGGLAEEGSNSRPRNIQFELYVAALLRLSGAKVARGEPDLRMVYGHEEVAVAVKRIRSPNPDQVQKNARNAAEQIQQVGLRGWIALNLDARFDAIAYSQPEVMRLDEFDATFDSVASALRRPASKLHVLGFILFGYIVGWHSPQVDGEAPRLHVIPPMRWIGLSDDEGEARLFNDFTKEWSARMTKRLQVLGNEEFTDLL